MKNLLFIILLTSVFLSCENDAEIFPQNFKNPNLLYNNITYVVNSDESLSKYKDGEFKYNIILSENIKGKVLNKDNNVRILNEVTEEYIDIINVEFYDTYLTFDITTSLGQTFYDFRMNLDEDIQYKKLNPIWGLVVDAVVDLLTDSPLEQCTAAMNSLNCPSGTSPTMTYEEGWFSTSCSVGCN